MIYEEYLYDVSSEWILYVICRLFIFFAVLILSYCLCGLQWFHVILHDKRSRWSYSRLRPCRCAKSRDGESKWNGETCSRWWTDQAMDTSEPVLCRCFHPMEMLNSLEVADLCHMIMSGARSAERGSYLNNGQIWAWATGRPARWRFWKAYVYLRNYTSELHAVFTVG